MKKSIAVVAALITAISTGFAAPPTAPLTVTVVGDGTVTDASSGISCPSDCDESYKKGSSVTLTATPDADSSFLGWSGACVGTDPTCVVKLTAPISVNAMFEATHIAYPSPVPKTGQIRCWDDQPSDPNDANYTNIAQVKLQSNKCLITIKIRIPHEKTNAVYPYRRPPDLYPHSGCTFFSD